jgi:hypothetical protein
MAVLFSVQSGNWTTSTTWKVVDPTSFANTETSATTLTVAFQTSTTFTPGAITVEGIAVKVSSRVASPSGTITVRLSTGGNAVAGTTVTLNVSDLPLMVTASAPTSFYWCYFKFASPVVLLAATAYSVQSTTSVGSQVSLGYSTTTTNWIRCLVTSTNATPAATDTLIVAGENTAAGVGVDYTVTMDNTSATIFGSNSAVFPALEIGKRGIVNFGISASTNYQLICNGAVNIGGGGVLNIGTSGGPIPSSSSALIRFTMSTTNLYQINVRQQGSLYSYGATKNARALLGSNASVGASSITTYTSTDWNRNDNIVIAPTTNVATTFNFLTMSATASGTTITLTATLSNAKTIWDNTDCEIINLTRNVRIVGPSSSVDCLHTYNGQTTIDMGYTEINFGAISNSVTDSLSGSLIRFTGCSFWGSSGRNLITDIQIPAGVTMSFDDCVFHNFNSIITSNTLASSTQSTVRFTNSWGIRAVSSWFFPSGSNCFTMDNCRFISSGGNAIVFGNNSSYDTGPIIIRNCVFKCNSNSGFGFNAGAGAYTNIGDQHDFSNNRMYLNLSAGFAAQGGVGYSYGWIIGKFEAFSNATANLNLSGSGDFKFLGATLYGGPTQASPIGVRSANPILPITFENFIMSTHSTADVSLIQTAGTSQLIFKNSSFLSTTKVQSPTTQFSKPSYVYSSRDNQVDGTHFIYRYNGTLRSDLIIFRTSPSSLRISPLSSVFKIESNPVFVPVESGKTITVGVWVRRSVIGDGAAYNGNLPRLICKVNSSTWTGLTDVVLATASAASNGAFEYISGTTPVAIDNAAFEIVVDCDGTAGWVNVDDMFISKQNATKGFKYWVNASPVPTSNSNNGSAVIFL